jgi:cobalt-zinc-cadmium efflux system protein
MAHSHHHNQLVPTQVKGIRRLIWALLVNVLLTVVQIIGGVLSGSLALIADAVHNFSDAASLMIALIARQWATKPADENRTFGYKRAELIGAMINFTSLILIGFYLLVEATMRIFQPEPIAGWLVVIIAGVALVVDVFTAALTYSLAKNSLNIRAAFLHNLADALSSVAVIIAGTLIILYEWYFVDTLCTFLIAGYVLYHGGVEIRSVIRILMQSTPADIDINNIVATLKNIESVEDVHHIHVWELDERTRSLEAHVLITEHDPSRMESVKAQIKEGLVEKFNITHSTIEFELITYEDENGCREKSIVSPH